MVFRLTCRWADHRIHRDVGIRIGVNLVTERERLMLNDDLYTEIAKFCGGLTRTYQHGYWIVSLRIGENDFHSRHYSQETAMTNLVELVDHTPEWNRAAMDYIQIIDCLDTRGHPSVLFRLFQPKGLKVTKIGGLYNVAALQSEVAENATLYAGLVALAKLLHNHPSWQNTVNQWIKDQREHIWADKKDQLSKTLLWKWLEQMGPLEICALKSGAYSASVWDIRRECLGRTATGDSRAEALRALGNEVAVHYRYEWASIVNEYYREQRRRQALSDGLVVEDNSPGVEP